MNALFSLNNSTLELIERLRYCPPRSPEARASMKQHISEAGVVPTEYLRRPNEYTGQPPVGVTHWWWDARDTYVR